MAQIRIEAVVQTDGELHLTNLPCRKGERVEAVLNLPERPGAEDRAAARERFLSRARASRFRSAGAYPSRAELHERA